MRFNFFLSFIFFIVFFINACEETTTVLEEGSTLVKEGFIKGTISTTRDNGLPVTFDFNHEYRDRPAIITGNAEVGNNIVFTRSSSLEGKLFVNGYSLVGFYLDSLTDTVPQLFDFELGEETDLGNDTTFYFYMIGFENTELLLTQYDYNQEASTMSGEFFVRTTNTNNGKEATITGSFSVKVYHYVIKPSSSDKNHVFHQPYDATQS